MQAMPFWTAFFKGVLCNVLVCMAVWMVLAGRSVVDKAIAIAAEPGVIFCSFGDMLRVPGSQKDLWTVKSEGGDVRMERFAPTLLTGTGGHGGTISFEKSDREVDADGATDVMPARISRFDNGKSFAA